VKRVRVLSKREGDLRLRVRDALCRFEETMWCNQRRFQTLSNDRGRKMRTVEGHGAKG